MTVKKHIENVDTVRRLPSVEEVLRRLKHLHGVPRSLILNEIRAELAERRDRLLSRAPVSNADIEVAVEERLCKLFTPSLRRVINATGIVLHTNLGRAPLSSFASISRYVNLELDLETGKRGKRDAHTASLLRSLLSREAIVVNNNAAAVYLVLNELASGHEVIISRGELVEIGEGFRIPDIMTASGALIREVGTTNRTTIDDYRKAINDRTRVILRVHTSNFRSIGFVARPSVNELSGLSKESGVHVFEDIGSGCIVDLDALGIDEPRVTDSLKAGINLVSFSCDKLLGGPQAGIIAGDANLVQRIRHNTMYRAFRVDKLVIQALQTTLRYLLSERWTEIPAIATILTSLSDVKRRAEYVREGIVGIQAQLQLGESLIGGGSTPGKTLPTWTLELADVDVNVVEGRLRKAATPIISRIERDRIILDMRTVFDDELDTLVTAIRAAT